MACGEYKKQLDKFLKFLEEDAKDGRNSTNATNVAFNKALLKIVGSISSDLATQYTNDQFKALNNKIKDMSRPYTDKLVMSLSILPEIEVISAAILCFKIRDSINKRLVIASKIEEKLRELISITDELTRGLPSNQGDDALIIQVRLALLEIKESLRDLTRYYLGMGKKTIDDPDNPGKTIELSGTGAAINYNAARQHVGYAKTYLSKETALTASIRKLVKDIQTFEKSYRDRHRTSASLNKSDAQIVQQFIESNRQLQIRETLFNDAVYIANQIPLAIATTANMVQEVLLSKNKATWKNAGDSLKENLLKEDLKGYQDECVVYLKNLRETESNWDLLKGLAEFVYQDSDVKDIAQALQELRDNIQSSLELYDKNNKNNLSDAYNNILFNRTIWNARLNGIETEFTIKEVIGSATLLQSTDESISRAKAVNNVIDYLYPPFKDAPYDTFIISYIQAYAYSLLATVSSESAVKANRKLNESMSYLRYAMNQDQRLIELINEINIEGMASYKTYQMLMNQLSSIPGGGEIISMIEDTSKLVSIVATKAPELANFINNPVNVIKSNSITSTAKCLAELLFAGKTPPETNPVSDGLSNSVSATETITASVIDKITESQKTAISFQQAQINDSAGGLV